MNIPEMRRLLNGDYNLTMSDAEATQLVLRNILDAIEELAEAHNEHDHGLDYDNGEPSGTTKPTWPITTSRKGG